MVFSSPVFIFIFLPVVFILNSTVMLIKRKWAIGVSNCLLLAASLFFYAWGEPVLIFLMLGVTFFCYLSALFIDFADKKAEAVNEGKSRLKTVVLIVVLAAALGILGFYKYSGFVVSTVASIPGLGLLGGYVPPSVLPLGISFYTFQILSYVIDVYRGKAVANRSFFKVLLYVSLFPQLVAGPIVKYTDIEAQLSSRRLEAAAVARGVRRFVCGLAKKMIIANTAAVTADGIFALGSAELTGASAWCGALAYMLQIYFDFSGYSDMAIGLGAMLGFKFNENFNYPYSAVSVQDFWRRWHISVSSWFKEYLYIPLGGNRRGRLRTCINKIVVFFFTGLWHGANFTFIVWGLWHGFFLLLEEYVPWLGGNKKQTDKASGGRGRKAATALRYIYAMLVVLVGFVIFRADSIRQACVFIGKMFTDFGNIPSSFGRALATMDGFTIFVFILGIILSFPISKWIFAVGEISGGKKGAAVLETLSFLGAVLLFAVCIAVLAQSSYNPFIYFRF